jgi:hypothetical protein
MNFKNRLIYVSGKYILNVYSMNNYGRIRHYENLV